MTKNLILLHGFCETKEMWSDFVKRLPAEISVYCLDLPGFGDFHFDVQNLTIENLADIVQTEINQLGITDYCVVGHSLGGYVALEIAKNHPNKLKGLGLFHSTVFADSIERIEKRNDVISFLEKHGTEVFVSSFIPQLFIAEKRSGCEEQITALIKKGSEISVSTLINITRSMQNRVDHSETLRQLNIPVQFIVGKRDQSVPLEASLNQIHLPKMSKVLMLDECGHMGMFEQPVLTAEAIAEFMNLSYLKY